MPEILGSVLGGGENDIGGKNKPTKANSPKGHRLSRAFHLERGRNNRKGRLIRTPRKKIDSKKRTFELTKHRCFTSTPRTSKKSKGKTTY